MRKFFRGDDDSGVAMVSVILVIALLTSVGVMIVEISTRNLTNAGRDRAATSALGAAEAGVSAAIGYLNNGNPSLLTCSPTCGTSNPWGTSPANGSPKSLTFPNGSATVWIQPLTNFNGLTTAPGKYLVHAVGRNAVGVRTIDETVTVQPLQFPIGIYVDNKIANGGTTSVTNESVFSKDCIDSRSHLQFVGIDPYYGIPAAAHSAKYITDKNLQQCQSSGTSDNNAVHNSSFCNASYPYDQDSMGGAFASASNGSSCTGAANQYTNSSYFDYNALVSGYGYQPKGLSDDQYAALKARAQAQGTYFTNAGTVPSLSPSTNYNPILYYDIPTSDTVSIQNELNNYAYQADTGGTCQQHPAIVLIVRGGGLKVSSNTNFTGAVFVPEGTLTYAGGASLTGTVWASNLTLTGNANIGLTNCYASATPGGILSVISSHFREVDR